MKFMVLLGRILFAAIFVMAAPNHFKAATIAYASGHGVPVAGILVPLSGVMALIGGVSVILGYKARYGAWLLVLFLIPVTFTMHNFWAVADPSAAMVQEVNFIKNISMLGAALMITYFGSGPFSLDGGNN
ncbi:MAG: DoxX family protein [Nitrospirota bacterium]